MHIVFGRPWFGKIEGVVITINQAQTGYEYEVGEVKRDGKAET